MEDNILVHEQENESVIKELYVFLSVDKNGKEGVIGQKIGDMSMPFITSKESVANKLKESIGKFKNKTEKKIVLAKFSNKAILEEF